MAAYRRVYDSCHLQADCQEPGSAPEPYARHSSTGHLYLTPAPLSGGGITSVEKPVYMATSNPEILLSIVTRFLLFSSSFFHFLFFGSVR